METPLLSEMLARLERHAPFFATGGEGGGSYGDGGAASAKAMQAELAAMKSRCEDLELMLREAVRGRFVLWDGHPAWLLRDGLCVRMDETGLPVMTDEARAALRGA